MPTLLLVEDDESLGAAVEQELAAAGWEVRRARDGEEALRLHESLAPDALVLDWALPRLSGLEVLRRVRARGATPVLMLTARADEADRVLGLEVGADDYLVKPFAMRELTARVRALLRRSGWTREARAGGADSGTPAVVSGELEVRLAEHRATLSGTDLDLTRQELRLLDVLARHPGRVFSRRYLLETAWDEPEGTGERAVDNVASRLRRKLGPEGARLEGVWGVGYRLRPPG